MTNRLATSAIALSTAFAAPAFADVTAADVWSNQQAFYTAMGVTLSGELDGGTLRAPQLNMILPQGIASLQITTDAAVTLTDNSDGTVSITYPSPMTISMAGGAREEGSFGADFVMTHDGYTIIASGEPGDITYASTAQNLRLEAGRITIEDTDDAPVSLEGFLTLDGWSGTSHVIEGDLISYNAASTTGTSIADFTFTNSGIVSRTLQTTLPLQSVIELALPMGGSNPMNLSAAIRDGLSVMIESAGEGSASESSTLLDGEVLDSQISTTGAQLALVRLDADGAFISADAVDIATALIVPMLSPDPLEFSVASVGATYDIPLNASADPQDFRVATTMGGIVLGDSIWNMFDPEGILPRDAAEIAFDVTGLGTIGADLLDFFALSEMTGIPPVTIDEVTIENLRIAAVGAEVAAAGAMTFDWTDFQTIPGIARPEGQVTVNLNGANALLDRLTALGLIGEQDLMMPRMMLGMFTTPVGDDALDTVLEVNSQGHVLANGQRLQ